MHQTRYMVSGSNRRIPYIEKDGMRIVAVPKGFDIAQLLDGEPKHADSSTSLPHPGYNLRFPTHLGLADCVRLVQEYLGQTEIALRFERNGIGVLATNFLPDALGLALFKETGEAHHDKRLSEEYGRILKSLQPAALASNRELTDILESSAQICYQLTAMNDNFVPKAGTFPSFWYETDFKHEDGTPSPRIVQAAMLSFDEELLKVLSRVSALSLGKEEIEWIKRLFSVEVIPV